MGGGIMFRPGGLRLSAQPIGATVNASPASSRVTTHDWGHCGSLLFDVRLFHPLPCAVSQRPENVRTQFLSLQGWGFETSASTSTVFGRRDYQRLAALN